MSIAAVELDRTMAERDERERIEQKVDRFMVGERAAAWLVGAVVMFIFANLWMMKSEIGQLQSAMAELRGQQTILIQSVHDFSERGSATAQQLKVMTEDIRERISTMESWMHKGDILKKDDWIRLESRVRDLEARKR